MGYHPDLLSSLTKVMNCFHFHAFWGDKFYSSASFTVFHLPRDFTRGYKVTA